MLNVSIDEDYKKDRNANQIYFLVPIQWSPWSTYSPCSSTCGNGTQYRTRICLLSNGKPAQGDEYKCKGENVEVKNCHVLPCPINGGWGKWTAYSDENCAIPCLNDTDSWRPMKKRYRKCDNPAPSMGGKFCLGPDTEEKECPPIEFCAVHGNWSQWSEWKTCSKPCGIGITSRSRTCSNPPPRNGGKHCDGMTMDVRYCNLQPCPINGGWGRFYNWSPCSKSCGKGISNRKRFCNNPEPKYGGLKCEGDNVEIEECNLRPCYTLKTYRNYKENSDESESKYGPLAEIELNGPQRNNYNFNPPKFNNHEYLDQKPTEFSKPKILDPEKPKVVVSFDTFREISAETYEKLKNGFEKPKQDILEFEDENLSDYDLESDAEFFSVEKMEQENCKDGFYYNLHNDQCMDVNECLLVTTKCPKYSECVNLPGTYRCDCLTGFKMILGRCLDVNECSLKTSGCSHICENVVGSFRCKCPDGMKLSDDGKTCENLKVEIKRFVREEESIICGEGFKNSNKSCVGKIFLKVYKRNTQAKIFSTNPFLDVNECTTLLHECEDNQMCLNTRGSYLCMPISCPIDYEIDEDHVGFV